MRGLLFSCAGLLFGLVAASGCSKEVKAEFPRPPATAELPAGVTTKPSPEAPEDAVVDLEPAPEPAPEPEIHDAEPEPRDAPQPLVPSGQPVEEPAPEPVSTKLASTDDGRVDPEVASKVLQAASLLSSLGGRELSQGQREQVAAARGFVAQAQRALDEGDARRALVLIDKGLILAEDVERTSRQ